MYDGVHPPKVEGVFKIDPMVAVYCEDGVYAPGQVYGTNVIRFTNQDMEKNTVDFSHYFEGMNEKGSGPGSFISGADNHFTAYFKEEGSINGVWTKAATFISGTITEEGMCAYANPVGNDKAIVAGESGAVTYGLSYQRGFGNSPD